MILVSSIYNSNDILSFINISEQLYLNQEIIKYKLETINKEIESITAKIITYLTENKEKINSYIEYMHDNNLYEFMDWKGLN